VVDAHRPREHAALGGADQRCGVEHRRHVDARLFGRAFDRPRVEVHEQFVETVDAVAHGLDVDAAAVEQRAQQAVQQCDITAWLHRQVAVGDHRRLRDAGVDDDDRAALALAAQDARCEQRVVVGHVRTPQEHDVGLLEVVVAARRSVATERQLVARHGARHAQRGVAVVVGQAHAEAHELAERVELLGHELPRRQHRDRAGAVLGDDAAEAGHHLVDGVLPRGHVAVDRGPEQAPVGVDHLVLAQALRAQPPAVHRMLGVTQHRHRAPVAHAEQHAAPDRAVAARGAHPVVRGAALAHGPLQARLGHAVAVAAVVAADEAIEAGAPRRAHGDAHRWLPAALRQNAPGMFIGTTVT
jgi:hypothetical protein